MDKKAELYNKTKIEVKHGIKPEKLPASLLQLAQYISTRDDLPEPFKNLMSEYLCINAHLHLTDEIKETKSFNSIYNDAFFDVAFKEKFTKEQIPKEMAKELVKRYGSDRGLTREVAEEKVGGLLNKSHAALQKYMYRKCKGDTFS